MQRGQTARQAFPGAEKCNEGTLSADERAEYEACVMAANIVAILHAKTRARPDAALRCVARQEPGNKIPRIRP